MEQKNEIEELKKWKNKYSKEIEQIQVIKKNNISLEKIDSKIINKIEELNFLEKRLKNNDEILMKKNVVYKLLYRASQDGYNVQTFHQKCDNIFGTLTIVKTTKGMRFGGYTEKQWNGDNLERKDCKDICFCFSLDLFKIYNHNENSGSSISCYKSYGPYFYGGDKNVFYIINKNGKLYGVTKYTTNCNSFGKIDKDYEINNGSDEFIVIELEVFQILFEN